MSFLSKLFKRKPGGTMVGNLLRKVIGKKTEGAIGNGAMIEQDMETPEQYNARMLQAVGAGVAAAQAQAYTKPLPVGNDASKNIAAGFGIQTFKQYGLYIIGAVLAIAGTIYLIFKKK